jgi:DNA-binding GntR family transcriptional regulator
VKRSGTRQSDTAYERLREMVIRGALKPGALIEEAAEMERLGVGRTPLREALQRLAHEDLIEVVPRRGYFVTTISAAEMFQIFEARLSMEIHAVRLAAERVTPDVVAQQRALLEEARAGIAADNRDPAWNLDIDERFHGLIAAASGNRYLAATLTRFYGLSVRTLYLSKFPITLVKDEIANYEAVFDAIAAADAGRAEAIMRRHLEFDPMTMIGLSPQAKAAEASKQSVGA